MEAALRETDSRRAAEAARAEGLARQLLEERGADGRREGAARGHVLRARAETLRASQEDFLALANERLGAVREQTVMDVEARQAAQQQAQQAQQQAIAGGMVAPVLRVAGEGRRADPRDGARARHRLRRASPADEGGDGDAGEAARRDRQPGQRAEGAGRARALGRDAAPPGRRAGRDDRSLRLRRADDAGRRRRPPAARHDHPPAGRAATSSSTRRRRWAPTWRRARRPTTAARAAKYASTPRRCAPT